MGSSPRSRRRGHLAGGRDPSRAGGRGRFAIASSDDSATATLSVMLFCPFRPILVVKAAVPQQNFLAVLIDDSRSMQITDWGRRRAAPS
jgi:hypothetical protein